MKLSRMFAFAFLFLLGVSSAIAQESIRLQFDVAKDGATVAKPQIAVTPGSAGSMEIADIGKFEFTATFRGSGVAIAFDINSGGKQFKPLLVIGENEPGTISWTSDSRTESFKLTVSWVR